jgi:hypothetical protein
MLEGRLVESQDGASSQYGTVPYRLWLMEGANFQPLPWDSNPPCLILPGQGVQCPRFLFRFLHLLYGMRQLELAGSVVRKSPGPFFYLVPTLRAFILIRNKQNIITLSESRGGTQSTPPYSCSSIQGLESSSFALLDLHMCLF